MDWFTFTISGRATLDLRKVPADKVGSIVALESWMQKSLETQAGGRWRRNIEAGILDAAAARLYLVRFLSESATRKYLIDLLQARFYEVIVDEVQDCSAEDVALLQLLLDAGIRLVLVGDPQQAIYGFRGGSVIELQKALGSVKSGTRLDGNFRSSPAICAAVNNLRSTSFIDRPVGRNKDIADPVQLLRYKKPSQVPAQLRTILAAHDIPESDLVVLAHARAKARACAGGGGGPETSATNRLVALATIVHTIQDESATPVGRAAALTELETALHQLAPEELAKLKFDEFLVRTGMSSRGYRERCLRLAAVLKPPYADKPSVFRANLAAQTDAQRAMGWKPDTLRKPNGDRWKSKPGSSADALQYATIHSYKGLQSPAVALVIPERVAGASEDDDGMSQWTSDSPGEARNVLYVGASRAEKLLIVIAHDAVFDQVQANLNRDRVAYEIVAYEIAD